MPKRPIDELRDAAVMMDVGDATDESAIVDIVPLAGRMLVIKDASIWQTQLADSIDPGRTNSDIPNSMQKLLARGSTDPIVGRTLLQANFLLKKNLLPARIVPEVGLEVVLALLKELDAIDRKATELSTAVKQIEDQYRGTSAKGASLRIPAIGDTATRAKSFIQGADHAVRTMWAFVRVFHPELQNGVAWFKLKARLLDGTDQEKALAPLIDALEPTFQFLRNTRNAVEHPKPGQEVIIRDYGLRADGKVHAPSIEVIEESTPLSETDLAAYFASTMQILVTAFESLLVNLCALHVGRVGAFDVEVIELEPDRRRYPHVKFCYASWIGDQLIPHLG